MAKHVWTPQPRQLEFMSRPEDEAFYGGAAGGGKSDCLVVEATRQVHIRYYKGLIMRKTYPDLSELIEKSQLYYPRAFPKARYNDQKHTWTFPSGAKIVFGAMQYEKDKTKYQGKAYDFIGFDELTHFTFDEYIYLQSRNRPNGPGTRVYRRSTGNPGGVGHAWVKERFIDPAPPGKTVWRQAEIIFPDGHKEKRWQSSVFIPSSVFDNKILMANDPQYIGKLALMPPKLRDALLYGDWDTYAGQFFEDFRIEPDIAKAREYGCNLSSDELKQQRRWTHVIDPIDLSSGQAKKWTIFRAYDFGYRRPFSCAWYAIDYEGTMYRVAELYGMEKDSPNEGVKWSADKQALEIKRYEEEHPWLKGKHITGIADPAIWNKSTGISVADTMDSYGVYFIPGDHERIAGWMQCHYRLQFDENGYSRFYCFNTCKQFIRTIPLMAYDEHKTEDLDSDLEDHIADEWRYACMSRPIKPMVQVERKVILSDPLNQFTKRRM